MRALETFGITRINYHHVAELLDEPGKVRIREGRLIANKPAILTPEAYVQDNMDGFGPEAREYFEYLKQHADSVRILKYGYQLSQEAFSEQVVTDSIEAVLHRVEESVQAEGDDFGVVIRGVDSPWDVSLIHFFWMQVTASAPINVMEFERAYAQEMKDALPTGVRGEVEKAFVKTGAHPELINDLAAFLRKKGVFEQYQDRFFDLVRTLRNG